MSLIPRRIGLFLYVFICISAGVRGQNSSVTGPMNTVAIVGAQVTLSCSISTATPMTWSFTPVGGTVELLCICGKPCVSGYNNSSPTTESCNLIISSVSLGMAGLYSCAPQGVTAQSAQLIVLASDPDCSRNVSGNNITVGQSVVMLCNFTYSATASTFSPSVTWSRQAPIYPRESNSSISLFSLLVLRITSASIPYVSPYISTTNISMSSTPGPNSATNVPSYSSSHTFLQLLVLYAPFETNITITGNNLSNGTASLNSTLTCNAVTYPGANLTYIWTSPSGSNTTGPTITLSILGTNLKYQCTATNAQGSGSMFIGITVTNTTVVTSSAAVSTTVVKWVVNAYQKLQDLRIPYNKPQ